MPSVSIPAIGVTSLAATASAASPYLAAASIGASALGQVAAGQAASASAKYNSQVAANNAKIATQNASYAGQEGESKAAQSEANTRATSGAILATQGASGVNVNTGSAPDVRQSQAQVGMLEAMTIRSNAARAAYGYQTQAASDTGQSALDKAQAGYDSTAGFVNAGTSILGGATKGSQQGIWGAAQNADSIIDTTGDQSFLNTAIQSSGVK